MLFDQMLAKVRDPQWRRRKRHAFPTTDLEVYKPGSTGCRMAGWTDVVSRTFFTAELYPQHNKYERHLATRTRANYAAAEFVPWTPQIGEASPLDVLSDDEQQLQQLLGATERIRQESIARVRQTDDDVAVALAEASRIDSQRTEAEDRLARAQMEWSQERGALSAAAQTAREEMHRLAGASVWHRLAWALKGR
jgi:hypothetical protein